MNRFERLLTMVPWLVRHPGISHQEVADHFQISREQMLQDVMLLTVTGIGQYANQQFDVDYSDDKIIVHDQLGLNRPFSFDSTEAACLLLGLEALANLPSELSGFESSEVKSVREKIVDSIPLASGVNAVQEHLQSEELLTEIANAIKAEKRISFNYWNNARDDVVRRTVSPLRIYTVNQSSRLDGFEHGKGWRSFRIANIDSLKLLNDSVEFESSFSPMETFAVEIELPIKMHHLLEVFSVEKRRSTDTKTLRATVRIAEPMWLAKQVLASGCAIKVLAPHEVRSQVETLVLAARSAYPRNSKAK
jgi:predicted DNA-binding transcriptional regulator YafY